MAKNYGVIFSGFIVFSQSDDAAVAIQPPVSGKGLLISPNPVQTQFFAELKDHANITAITIYNQAGKVVLQKTVSGARIAIQKAEIGAAGVYYIRVFAEKDSYLAKLVVL